MKWLVVGVLPAGSAAAIWGPPKVGKSFVALDLAACVASGAWWHGREVQQQRVLYVNSRLTVVPRLCMEAWKAHNQMAALDGLHSYMLLRGLLDPRDSSRLISQVRRERYGLVVLDSLTGVMGGVDLDRGSTMDMLLDALIRLQEAGASVLLVHTSGKDVSRGMRGSAALKGALETEIEVVVPGDEPRRLTLICRQQKHAPAFDPIRLALQVVRVPDGPGGDEVTSYAVGLPTWRDFILRRPVRIPHAGANDAGPSWPALPGLRADERPEILQAGERVLRRLWPRGRS
jgi:hypothetical protein